MLYTSFRDRLISVSFSFHANSIFSRFFSETPFSFNSITDFFAHHPLKGATMPPETPHNRGT